MLAPAQVRKGKHTLFFTRSLSNASKMNHPKTSSTYPFAPNDPYSTPRIATPMPQQTKRSAHELVLPEKLDPTLDAIADLKNAARSCKVAVPVFEVQRKGGKDHNPIFHARASWNNNSLSGNACAGSKKEARNKAAYNLLCLLQGMMNAKPTTVQCQEPVLSKPEPISVPMYNPPFLPNHADSQYYRIQNQQYSQSPTPNKRRTLHCYQPKTIAKSQTQPAQSIPSTVINGSEALLSGDRNAIEHENFENNEQYLSSPLSNESNPYLPWRVELPARSVGSKAYPIGRGVSKYNIDSPAVAPLSRCVYDETKRVRFGSSVVSPPLSEAEFHNIPIPFTERPKSPKRRKLNSDAVTLGSEAMPATSKKAGIEDIPIPEIEIAPTTETQPLGRYVPRRKTRSVTARERERKRAMKAVRPSKNYHLPLMKQDNDVIIVDNSNSETEGPTKPFQSKYSADHSR